MAKAASSESTSAGTSLEATPSSSSSAAVSGAVTPRKSASIKSEREGLAFGIGKDKAEDDAETKACIEMEELTNALQMNAQSNGRLHVPNTDEFLNFETYVFDCDGVIWGISDEDMATSVKTINYLLSLEKRVMFVTNNSNKTRAEFVKTLSGKGVDFGERSDEEKLKMVISASFTTAKYLKENGLHRPFVITSHTGILEELKLAGIEYFATISDDGQVASEFQSHLMMGVEPEIEQIIEKHPDVDCIVVGWDLGITARKVATAINYIRWHEDINSKSPGYRQMPIIACSGDAGGVLGKSKFMGQEVKLRAIGNGAMADIIARSFDPPLEWLDMGKPSDLLIELLRSPEGYGVDAAKALMIGDTLQTDIVFGKKAQMKTLLVLTGVTSLDELKSTLSGWQSLRRPTFVLPKLGSLLHTFKI